MACSTTPPSGTMLEHSTGDPGVDAWILSLRDFPANPSLSQDSSGPNWMNETDGLTPFVSFEKSSPIGAFWKTCPDCCLPGMDISEPFSETWPRAGLMLDGKLSVRQSAAHPTNAIDSGLYAGGTHDAKRTSSGITCVYAKCYRQQKWERRIGEIGSRLWATPQARDHFQAHTPEYVAKKKAEGHGMRNLNDEVAMFPTPLRGNEGNEGGNAGGMALRDAAGGTLNPEFVEWMMNWPRGWTSLEPLTGPIKLTPETWAAEWPDVPRVAIGVENRAGRLKALGNGQVPLCAAAAWRLLLDRKEENQ